MKKELRGLDDIMAGTLFCIGRNYAEHAQELEHNIPDQPLVFLKPTGSIIYNGDTVQLPAQSENVHHEVELVVAIGKGGKKIPEQKALGHVAGYAVGVDITARDIQQQAKQQSHPWSVAKGFDGFAPLGRFIPASTISDPQDLAISLSVNGQQRQHGLTERMIFPVARLINYLSEIFTLSKGDLIFTGTPKGVGPIHAGDKLTASLKETTAHLSITVS